MASVLDKSVSKAEDGTWAFQCPGVKGDLCGDQAVGGGGFRSSEWPTKDTALARGEQHFSEHRLGAEIRGALEAAESEAVAKALKAAKNPDEVDQVAVRGDVDHAAVRDAVVKKSKHAPMQELHDFRADKGLVVADDGSVSLEEL